MFLKIVLLLALRKPSSFVLKENHSLCWEKNGQRLDFKEFVGWEMAYQKPANLPKLALSWSFSGIVALISAKNASTAPWNLRTSNWWHEHPPPHHGVEFLLGGNFIEYESKHFLLFYQMSLSQDQTKTKQRWIWSTPCPWLLWGSLFQRLDCLSLFLLVHAHSPLGREMTCWPPYKVPNLCCLSSLGHQPSKVCISLWF